MARKGHTKIVSGHKMKGGKKHRGRKGGHKRGRK